MRGKYIAVVLVLVGPGAAIADSNTTCRRTLMGGMDCTTTSSEHPADAANRSMQNGLNSLSAAIIARGERRREERDSKARASAAPHDEPVADLSTGNSFLVGCKNPTSSLNAGLCWGFVEGFMQREFLPGTSKLVCLPASHTKRQVYDTILQYMETHPADRHQSLPLLTAYAVYSSFPCASSVVQSTPTAKP